MASANLDLVRSIYAAWEHGDFSSAEWADPEIEFAVIADGPTSASTRGLRGMAQSFGEFLATWDDYRVEVDEYRELDGERVLVLLRASGRGKTSGLDLGEMRTAGATLFHVDAGTVTRLVIYPYRERALVDLGLAAGDGSTCRQQDR
jgi:ketosteroid isomerase-like protein